MAATRRNLKKSEAFFKAIFECENESQLADVVNSAKRKDVENLGRLTNSILGSDIPFLKKHARILAKHKLQIRKFATTLQKEVLQKMLPSLPAIVGPLFPSQDMTTPPSRPPPKEPPKLPRKSRSSTSRVKSESENECRSENNSDDEYATPLASSDSDVTPKRKSLKKGASTKKNLPKKLRFDIKNSKSKKNMTNKEKEDDIEKKECNKEEAGAEDQNDAEEVSNEESEENEAIDA